MSSITRDLFPYATIRQSGELVEMIFETSIALPDGSYSVKRNNIMYRARVTDLSSDQIQRLQEGGMTVHSGSCISIPYELPSAPDSIIYNTQTYKVMESTITEGVSIFLVDKQPVGFANVEQGAM